MKMTIPSIEGINAEDEDDYPDEFGWIDSAELLRLTDSAELRGAANSAPPALAQRFLMFLGGFGGKIHQIAKQTFRTIAAGESLYLRRRFARPMAHDDGGTAYAVQFAIFHLLSNESEKTCRFLSSLLEIWGSEIPRFVSVHFTCPLVAGAPRAPPNAGIIACDCPEDNIIASKESLQFRTKMKTRIPSIEGFFIILSDDYLDKIG